MTVAANEDAPVAPEQDMPAGEVQVLPASFPLMRVVVPAVVVLSLLGIGGRLVVMNERSTLATHRARAAVVLNQKLMELHSWVDSRHDPAELRTEIQVMGLDPTIRTLALVGHGQQVLVSGDVANEDMPASRLPGFDEAAAAEALRTRRPVVVQEPDGAWIREYMPIAAQHGVRDGGSDPWILFGSVDLTGEFSRLRATSWNYSARLLAVAASFVVLFYAFLSEAVMRRLGTVVDAIFALARGDLSSRSAVTGSDEIGSVGRAFNAMAERVQRQHDLLVRSQARYQQVVEGSEDLVLVTTLLGRVLFINQASVRMLGRTPEECFGRSVYDFIAPEDLPAAAEWAASVVAQHLERSSTEFRVVHADGSRRYILLSTRRVPAQDGGGEHFEHFVRDRTEVFLAESEKKASQLRFEALFDAARDAVLLADADLGRILAVNSTARKMLGCSGQELVATSMEAVLPGIGGALARAEGDGPAGSAFEAELVALDGQRVPVEVSASVVALPGGQRVLQANCRDMRERRRLEEQIAHSERMSVIGQLAGGVAHDFNNQLAGILGYAELLTMRLPEGPLRSYARRIEQSAQHSAELTSKLLAFSRRGKYREQAVDMNAVLDDVAGILRHSIDPRIVITLEPSSTPAWVSGDASQLQSAVLNLGVNARDAMPDGGELLLRTRLTDSTEPAVAPDPPSPMYVEVEVRDTGIGMDPATLAHAFEPFFTTKAVGAGTGLGLAAVYGTVIGHRGTVHLESAPGQGTSCRLWLPLAEPPAGEATTGEDAEEGDAVTGACILVVDDEKPVRDLLAEMLGSAGFLVHTCGGGVEALQAWKDAKRPFDLVLLDLMMPGMSGAEFMAELRKFAPDARVLLLSGYADEATTKRLVAAGAKGMLNKPCPRGTLLEAVRRLLAEEA